MTTDIATPSAEAQYGAAFSPIEGVGLRIESETSTTPYHSTYQLCELTMPSVVEARVASAWARKTDGTHNDLCTCMSAGC